MLKQWQTKTCFPQYQKCPACPIFYMMSFLLLLSNLLVKSWGILLGSSFYSCVDIPYTFPNKQKKRCSSLSNIFTEIVPAMTVYCTDCNMLALCLKMLLNPGRVSDLYHVSNSSGNSSCWHMRPCPTSQPVITVEAEAAGKADVFYSLTWHRRLRWKW